jgi:ATP-dependent RNA helicase DHX29
MAKKKTPARRNDARGYGNTPQHQQGGSAAAAAATSSSAKVQVSSRTHTGLKDLLGELDDQNNSSLTSPTSTSVAVVVESDRFASKLQNIVGRLEDDFRFSFHHVEQVAQALGYEITLDTALDWLCLQLTTQELPALFTEGSVRDDTNERQQGDESLTVLKLAPVVGSSSVATFEFNSIASLVESDSTKEKPLESTSKEPSVSREEQDEANARKAWLLAQYQYADHDDEEQEVDPEPSKARVSEIEPTEIVKPEIVLEVPKSIEEQRLELLEADVKDAEEDLHNEANNYMRSKTETKQLGIKVKKLKQQVISLRKKVEKSKGEGEPQAEETKTSTENEVPKEKDNSIKETNTGDDGDDGGGFFSMFEGAEEEAAAAPPPHPLTTSDDSSESLKTPQVDYSIPNGWTGTTPQKTLEEWLKKRKLSRAKYNKLPRNNGYRLTFSPEKKKSMEFEQEAGKEFQGDAKEYVAIRALYALEPTLPLYRVFPPPFRELWLSWVGEVQNEQDQEKQEIEAAKRQKIDHLLSLIASASKKSSTNSRSDSKDLRGQNGEERVRDHDPAKVVESWEDDDHVPEENSMKPKPATSSLGKKLRDEFVRRQSSKAYQDMKKVRAALPMLSFREKVLDTVRDHQVTILCAETGAGKTSKYNMNVHVQSKSSFGRFDSLIFHPILSIFFSSAMPTISAGRCLVTRKGRLSQYHLHATSASGCDNGCGACRR